MEIFERLESEVRGYCRSFPVVFERARGCRLWDEDGNEYLDFFAGAGALNYGHNPVPLREALIEYLTGDGIVHGLDMATAAKRRFLERFEEVLLQPRGLEYKLQFPGPTGTNAVESALKLARKATGRQMVVGFTNAFHGMTLGSLAVTGNGFKRRGAGVPLAHGSAMPFDGFLGEGVDTLDVFERYLRDGSSGLDTPAAVILETIQAEGGVNAASRRWLRRLESLCREHGILLIVDDIQVGCGRTGPFFSFEGAGIRPDMVCLSKSLSGFGLPMALVLIRPDLDVWEPGEHNGTFRGNNAAFVTASAALDLFWRNDALSEHVEKQGALVRGALESLAERHADLSPEVRGVGLIQGLALGRPGLAKAVSRAAFARGLVLETAGAEDEVVKLLPPLVIDEVSLKEGLDILASSLEAARDEVPGQRAGA